MFFKRKRSMLICCILVSFCVCSIYVFSFLEPIISIPIKCSAILYSETGNNIDCVIDLYVERHPFIPFRYTGSITLNGTDYLSQDKRSTIKESFWMLLKEKWNGNMHTTLWQTDAYYKYNKLEAILLDIYYNESNHSYFFRVIDNGTIYYGSSNYQMTLNDIQKNISLALSNENSFVYMVTEETLKNLVK